MPSKYSFYKMKKSDRVYWVDDPSTIGVWLFSFDKKKIYNLFVDYPQNLTTEEKAIFDKDNPYWKKFFNA